MPYDRTNPTKKPLAKELNMVNREYDEIIEETVDINDQKPKGSNKQGN